MAYFGDLDADGLGIPASAAALATREGLPVVRRAKGLYGLLLERGTAQLGQAPVEPEKAADLVRWLGDSAVRAEELLVRGARIPQEALTARLLARDTDLWIADLG